MDCIETEQDEPQFTHTSTNFGLNGKMRSDGFINQEILELVKICFHLKSKYYSNASYLSSYCC